MDGDQAQLLLEALWDIEKALLATPRLIWLDGKLINTLYITKIEPGAGYKEIEGFKVSLITGDTIQVYNQSIEELAKAMNIEMPTHPEKKEKVPR